jgi:hypothetical protein
LRPFAIRPERIKFLTALLRISCKRRPERVAEDDENG